MTLTIIIVFFFVWIFTAATIIFASKKDKPIEKLKFYDEDYVEKEKYKNSKKEKVPLLKTLSKFIPKSKLNNSRSKRMQDEMMKADLPVTLEELLIIKIITSAFLTIVLFSLSRNLIVSIFIFILIWNLPNLIISRLKKVRIKDFDSELNEGVTIISNSLKAGYSFLQAVTVVAQEMKDPFSKEFKKLLKEMSLGISEEEALKNLMSRMESEDLRLVVNAILIQKDIGGNLSEILDNISETVRERQKIKNELKTLTAQGKLSGMIVIAIPIFLGVIIYLFNKEYIMLLFTTTPGIIMVIMSVLNQIFGVIIIRKIINIDM